MPNCNTTSRLIPMSLAREYVKRHIIELRMGLNVTIGVGKFKASMDPDKCRHWLNIITIGDTSAVPPMCFTSRQDAVEYVEYFKLAFIAACREEEIETINLQLN